MTPLPKRGRGRAKATAEACLKRMKNQDMVPVTMDWLREFKPVIHRPDKPDEWKICWDWMPAADALLGKLSGLIRICGFEKAEYIKAEDYPELAVKISDDAINYSAPVTLKKWEIFTILDNIRGHRTRL